MLPLLPRSGGEAVMNQLASASGGKSFFPGSAEAMSEAFEQIALELRHQYSIGYTPTNATDGRWHRLKVTVTPPAGSQHLIVRSRNGYYAVAGLVVVRMIANVEPETDEPMMIEGRRKRALR